MAAAAAAAAVTLERLEALSCPPVAPVLPLEPAQALQLLCTPSSHRLALLEWLCCRVHPPLAHRLDALQSAPKDARLRELAELGAELMLCRADDTALVEGTAPPERQLEFIRDLLDAAPPSPESEDSFESKLTTLLAATQLLRAVLETPEGGAALNPPPPPSPPSFREDGDSPPPPTRTPPRGRVPELEAALGGAREQLELLEAQSAPLGGSPDPAAPPHSVLPLLGVAGGHLTALATAFGATELRDPWGGGQESGGPRAPPPHAPPAPPGRQGVKELVQSLGVVAQLEDIVTEVTQLAGGGQQRSMATRTATLQQRFGGPHQD